MKKIKSLAAFFALGSMLFLSSCDKTEEYDVIVPPTQAHFMNNSSLTYEVLVPNSSFWIPVGVTQAADVDRQITFTVTSPTGAVAGTEYTLPASTVTIPAGKVVDSIEIRGNLDEYLNDEKDTLIINIVEPNIPASDYNSKLTLVLRGPCFEGNVVLDDIDGDFNANEDLGGSTYGPYAVSVGPTTLLSPTTARISVNNIYDFGWGPIDFILDWTDPANRTAICVQQNGVPGSDAGGLNSAYSGAMIAVIQHPSPSVPPSFSACNQTYNFSMMLGVSNGAGGVLGYFTGLEYKVALTR